MCNQDIFNAINFITTFLCIKAFAHDCNNFYSFVQQFQMTQKQIKINIPLFFFLLLLTIKIEIIKGVLKSSV